MATSVIRRFWVDLDDMNVSAALGDRNPVTLIRLKARDSARIGFQFHRGGVPELLASGTVLTFGIKAKNDFAGDYLASVTSFTAATTTNTVEFADTDFYYGQLNLNTTEITTAIGTDPTLSGMAELEIDVSGGGARASTDTIEVTISNDVNQGGEGTPTSADPPYPSASEVQRWKPGITSLVGGTSADLDSVPTTGLTPPYAISINNQDVSATNWETWILTASTATTDTGAGRVRGADYNASTNAKVWFRQSLFPAVDDSSVSAAASATNYTPSAATVEGHLAGIDTKFGVIGSAIANLVEDTTPQLGGNLDANGSNIDFDDNTGIRDDSANEQLIFQKTASAVNHLEATNAATGNAPSLKAAGSDTNVNLVLGGKGTGNVELSSNLDLGGNNLIVDSTKGINDDSGNEVVVVTKAASAVNYLGIANAATGNGVSVSAAGDDTNVSLLLVSKGSGTVQANGSRVITTAGISGGQTLTGGTASGNALTLESTSNATKGGIVLAAGNWLEIPEISAPSTPSSGFGRFYVSTTGKPSFKDDAGTVTELGSPAMWHNFFIPGIELHEATTAGAAAITKSETATNKVNWKYFLFDPSTAESVWGILILPDDWDSTSNIKAKIHWRPFAGTGDVVWGVAGRAWSGAPGTALDSAVGTESTATDTCSDSAPLTSPATSSITFAGSPAAGATVLFRVRRVATDAADTLTQDAELHGISFQLRLTGAASAW